MDTTVHVHVDMEDVRVKTKELIQLLEKANSLADELADSLKKLDIDVEI